MGRRGGSRTAESAEAASASKPDRPALAASLMLGALILLSFQDSLVKLISAELSLWQFQLVRACFNIAMLALIAPIVWGGRSPWPKSLPRVALRSLCLVGAMVCFFGGVPFLSLAEIAAGLYVFPLFVTLLSALFMGEKVGPRRAIAVLTGFGGALLIMKPGGEAFQPVALMPLGAAFCYAATILITRNLCRDESPATLALGVSLGYGATGLIGVAAATLWAPPSLAVDWPYLFTGWRPLGLATLGLVAICAMLHLTANLGLSTAYQSAESSWLAPFDYTYLAFAAFWSWAMWDQFPDAWALLGLVMIAGSGGYVAWRERRESRLRRANLNRALR